MICPKCHEDRMHVMVLQERYGIWLPLIVILLSFIVSMMLPVLPLAEATKSSIFTVWRFFTIIGLPVSIVVAFMRRNVSYHVCDGCGYREREK